jgi:S-adenosylmethionine hydrolase
LNAEYFLQGRSSTFHGRDIFAPVAAALAEGVSPADLGPILSDPVRIGLAEAKIQADGTLTGRVMHIDHFGNCVTNLAWDHLQSLLTAHSFCLRVRECEIRKLLTSYSEAAADPGTPFLIAGSAGFLEISVCCSSAARTLHIAVGEPVRLWIGR